MSGKKLRHPKEAAAARTSAAIRAEVRRAAKAAKADPSRRKAASGPDIRRTSTTIRLRDDLRARIQAAADARGWSFAAVLEEMLAHAVDAGVDERLSRRATASADTTTASAGR